MRLRLYIFGMPSPPIFAPSLGGMNFNNFGQGGAGSFNSGRKKRSPQTYVNYGTGGSGSTNYNYGQTYNNWGSGGAGSRNFLNSIKYRYL